MASSAISIHTILHRLADHSRRPRYAFLVLNLISEVADDRGEAGPFIAHGPARVPIREWLCEQLMPMSERPDRRDRMRNDVRTALTGASIGAGREVDEDKLESAVHERAMKAGKTNISRAVTDLVRAGLVRRHYAGWRKDHANRGAGRHAVYVVEPDTLSALRRRDRLI